MSIDMNEYHRRCKRTLQLASTKDVDDDIDIVMLTHACLKMSGEIGEVCDIVGKWMGQGHELDKQRIIEELGDVMWHIAEACSALNISLDDVAWGNIVKVSIRYPDGFDPVKSVNRNT